MRVASIRTVLTHKFQVHKREKKAIEALEMPLDLPTLTVNSAHLPALRSSDVQFEGRLMTVDKTSQNLRKGRVCEEVM